MEDTTHSTPFQAPSLEELAPLFPSYGIEAFIAQGGMGAVYQARQISLDRTVAIKILPREFGADPEFRKGFAAEAKAMARLNHPNLIGVYDFGDADGMLFLVMELVRGNSLHDSCCGKAIDPAQAAEIIIAVCRGIDHANSAGILHRDIKPSNILLALDATPKVGDFGLASPMNQSAESKDFVYGTPGYTAPEIIHQQMVDQRADIFSIGVMLHELLTGSLPDESRTAPSRISGCPVGYDAIVARSTNPNPQLRYNTAAELADALKKVSTQIGPVFHMPMAARAVPRVQVAHEKKSPTLALTLIATAVVVIVIIFASQSKEMPKQVEKKDNPAVAPAALPVEPTPPEIAAPVEASPIASMPEPEPETLEKDPLKQLATLKDKLASGERDQFPDTAAARNGSHFLVLDHPLPWQEARDFAEAHGAHLAVLPNPEDREWLIQQFQNSSPIWVGAGLAANDSWQWLDGASWNAGDTPSKPPVITATRGLLAVSTTGSLMCQNATSAHPFTLQWRDDASNPCTMDAQLKRTLESIEKNGIIKAEYPVGTRTYEQSHFLLLDIYSPWEKAYKFASDHKAHLAVPSSPAENQWLISAYSDEEKPMTFWLGGHQLDPSSPWQWITKEVWHSSGWQPDQPGEDSSKNRMSMSLTDTSSSDFKNWVSSNGKDAQATAILLEWSDPEPVNTAAGEFDLAPWLASVNAKIVQRVKPDVDGYEKEYDQLVSQHVRSMKREAKKGMQADKVGDGGRSWNIRRVGRFIDSLDKIEQADQISQVLPRFAPKRLKEIQANSATALKELSDAHEAKLLVHLEFYTKGLIGKATELEGSGFVQQARTLQNTVEKIGTDTDAFVKTLGM